MHLHFLSLDRERCIAKLKQLTNASAEYSTIGMFIWFQIWGFMYCVFLFVCLILVFAECRPLNKGNCKIAVPTESAYNRVSH